MGRGSSKSGGGASGGGLGLGGGSTRGIAGTGGALPQITNSVIPPTPQQVASGNVLPAGGVAFSDFSSMTDDEKADVINDALSTGVPMFLDDSGLQRFAYYTGMSDKPTIVSDAQLDQISGKSLYRTVNDVYDRSKDIGYTSGDIIKQISEGDFTMYSDSGGSAYGKGIYFADSYTDSSWYGNSGKNPKTMRAKVTSGKSISATTLSQDFRKAYNRGDKLALACAKADSASQENLYALAKGYSVVTDNWSGYTVVLNRGALTVSSTAKKTNIGGTDW